MPNVTADRAGYVAALPTFTQSAEMIGIHPSGIGRAVKRLGIEPVRWGNRDKHLSVADLMVLAQDAHRETTRTVADRLLAFVRREHPDHADAIGADIGAFFTDDTASHIRLPPDLIGSSVLSEVRSPAPARESVPVPASASAAAPAPADASVEPILRAPSEPETARRLVALYTLHGGNDQS